MSEIPRKSSFNLSDEERKDAIKMVEEEINNNKNPHGMPHQELVNEIIGWLYYQIAMQDFDAYSHSKESSPNMRENVQKYLTRRAYYSAMLQSFIDDVSARGYKTEKAPFEFQEGQDGLIEKLHDDSVMQEKKKMLESGMITQEEYDSNILWHGTHSKVSTEELGKADENGMYHLKDGIFYLTDLQRRASRFGDNIHKIAIGEDDGCARLPVTDGYTCFLYQDELIDLNQREDAQKIKYLYSNRPQILDIENFADFVYQRDSSIQQLLETYDMRLPRSDENLSEYLTAIGVDKDIEQQALAGRRGVWSTAKENNSKGKRDFLKYDEMFPSLDIVRSAIEATEETVIASDMTDQRNRINSLEKENGRTRDEIQNTHEI